VEQKYILYAEDDLDDQDLMRDIMQTVDAGLEIICVENGNLVLEFLNRLPPGTYYPCFLVLDMNMPALGGLETLKMLKHSSKYADLPAIIFSTSNLERDRRLALECGAAEFITKPVHEEDITNICKKFADYCHSIPQMISRQ